MYRVTYKMAREPDRKYEKVICRKPTGSYKKEFRVYFCDTCNRAWEIDTSVKSSFVVLYYRDFPKLSLEEMECDDCKAKKKR